VARGDNGGDWEELRNLSALRRLQAPFAEVTRMRDVHQVCDTAGLGPFVRQCLDGHPGPTDPVTVVREEADRTVARGIDPSLLRGAIYSERRAQREGAKGIQDVLMKYELEKAGPG